MTREIGEIWIDGECWRVTARPRIWLRAWWWFRRRVLRRYSMVGLKLQTADGRRRYTITGRA